MAWTSNIQGITSWIMEISPTYNRVLAYSLVTLAAGAPRAPSSADMAGALLIEGLKRSEENKTRPATSQALTTLYEMLMMLSLIEENIHIEIIDPID